MKRLLRRFFRYAVFILYVYLYEKPRGLDFHMRDQSFSKATQGKYSGYAVTPISHVKKFISCLNISKENSFLDVGCGKGLVLSIVEKFSYNKIQGIDIVEELVEIAKRNMTILGIQNRVQVLAEDATKFQDYGSFDHIFFSNPFPPAIMKPVLEKIIESLNDSPREVMLIYYNPHLNHQVIMETGRFQVVQELFDPIKGYKTHIYRSC